MTAAITPEQKSAPGIEPWLFKSHIEKVLSQEEIFESIPVEVRDINAERRRELSLLWQYARFEMVAPPQKNGRGQGIRLDHSDAAGFRSQDGTDIGRRPGRMIWKFFTNPGRPRSKRDQVPARHGPAGNGLRAAFEDIESRSEEHTSELQSRFGISDAVFCLKKK